MSNLTQLFAAIVSNSELNIPQTTPTDSTIKTVLQLVFGIGGAAALLIIVVAGFRYVVSQGDPQATNKARNSVIYAIAGLVVCALAFSIVTLVIDRIA